MAVVRRGPLAGQSLSSIREIRPDMKKPHNVTRPPHAIQPKAAEPAKPVKAAKPFSKSKDLHEDRGARQMKTSHSAQSQIHSRAL